MSEEIHQLGAKFASWAPRVLINEHLHEKMVEGNPNAGWLATTAHSPSGLPKSWTPNFWRSLPPTESAYILAELASNANMESAWHRLREVTGDDFEHAAFYFSRMAISHIALYRAHKARTKAQRKKHLTKIQLAAKHLKQLMSDCLEFNGIEISNFLSFDELDKLTHNLVHLALDDARRTDALANRLPLDEASVRQYMNFCLRNFSNLLDAVTEEASQLAKTPGLSKRAVKTASEVNYFIKEFAVLVHERLGDPVVRVVEAFTGAIYPCWPIEKKKIEKSCERAIKEYRAASTDKIAQ